MAQTQTKNIALIHNSLLPAHLGKLSTIIAAECQTCYCREDNLEIRVLDLTDYDILSHSSTSPSTPSITNNAPSQKTLLEWQAEITQCSAFILLFPYHIWSRCNILKIALSESIFPPETHPRTVSSKPVLLVGFGKKDVWLPSIDGYTQRTMSRKSFSMMQQWAIERGMKPIPPQAFGLGDGMVELWPEFNCYDDYWKTWEETGEVVIGGQQSEEWERAGYDRCQAGMGRMVEMLERKNLR